MLWVMERWGSRLSVESWQLCWQFPASGKSECCWGGDGLRWVSGLGSWLDQHPFGNHGSLAEVWTTLCLHYHPQTLGFPCRFPCLLPSSLGGMQGWFIFMGSQGIGQLVWGISPASVVALPGWTLDMPRARLCRWGVEGEQCRGWQESSAGDRRAVQVGADWAIQVSVAELCRCPPSGLYLLPESRGALPVVGLCPALPSPQVPFLGLFSVFFPYSVLLHRHHQAPWEVDIHGEGMWHLLAPCPSRDPCRFVSKVWVLTPLPSALKCVTKGMVRSTAMSAKRPLSSSRIRFLLRIGC